MLHKHLVDLLQISIEQLYGHLPAEIFTLLANNGRLTIPEIRDISGVKTKDIQNTLAILIQQHLAARYTDNRIDKTTGVARKGPTFFSVNAKSAYDQTIRAGKTLRYTADKFGEPAAAVVLNLLRFGHAKVSELEAAYGVENEDAEAPVGEKYKPVKPVKSVVSGVKPEPQDSEGVNNDLPIEADGGAFKPKDHTNKSTRFRTKGQLHTALDELLSAGLVIPVHEQLDYWPAQDRFEHVKSTIQSVELRDGKTQKSKQEEFDREVHEEQKKWQEEADRYFGVSKAKRKRASRPDHGVKRAKHENGLNGLTNGNSHHHDLTQTEPNTYIFDSGAIISDNLTLRVNFDKVDVYIRDKFLVDMAHRHIGPTTAQVFGAVLRVLERKTLRCVDPLKEEEDPGSDDEDEEEKQFSLCIPVKIGAIEEELDPDLDLRLGLADGTVKHETNGVKHRDFGNSNGTNGDHHGISDDDGDDDHGEEDYNPGRGTARKSSAETKSRINLVTDHLQILAEDPRKFVHSNGEAWLVPMLPLIRRCQQLELENTVTGRYGYFPVSILRILKDKGKLEEKQIVSIGMVPQRETRQALALLLNAGIIESQEVPRDTNRSVTKAAYLYSFTPLSARQTLLGETYFAMTRFLLRLEHERKFYANVIDKADRSDVRDHVQKWFSVAEKTSLTRWFDIEERILGAVGRLDDVVALFRDFVGEEWIPEPGEGADRYEDAEPAEEETEPEGENAEEAEEGADEG